MLKTSTEEIHQAVRSRYAEKGCIERILLRG